jgi:ADP-ribose pyrophosphatase
MTAISFTVREARLPNGVDVRAPVLSHPGAAAIVPFIDATTIIMIRQYRASVGEFVWEVPAGTLCDETPLECARRELREEVGRTAARFTHLGSLWMEPGYTDEVMHVYSARELTVVGYQHERDEVIEQHEMNVDQAARLVREQAIWDAKTLVALDLARCERSAGRVEAG